MKCHIALKEEKVSVPATITKAFEVWIEEEEGKWRLLRVQDNNYRRLVRIPVKRRIRGIRWIPKETWGHEKVRVFRLWIS